MYRTSTDGQPLESLAYRIQDAVRVSGIGRTKFYELIKNGELQTISVGRRRLISAESLRALLETRTDAAKQVRSAENEFSYPPDAAFDLGFRVTIDWELALGLGLASSQSTSLRDACNILLAWASDLRHQRLQPHRPKLNDRRFLQSNGVAYIRKRSWSNFCVGLRNIDWRGLGRLMKSGSWPLRPGQRSAAAAVTRLSGITETRTVCKRRKR
jgi:excisionase family DNA binding protein